MRKWLLCTFLIAGVACNNNSGNGNGDGGNGDGGGGGGGNFAVVSKQTPIGPGTDCANGGVKVELGLDNGDGDGVARDSTLQPGEVDKTEFICNQGAFTTLTTLTPLQPGDTHCPNGGTQVDYGFDNGDGGGTASDSVLQAGEVDGTSYVCLSMPGTVLVTTTPILPGDTDCPYGGNTLSSGVDNGDGGGTANDGVLQAGEVDLTSKKCWPAPEETFPNPGGALGSAFIDASGGVGAGSARSGNGGWVEVKALGASLPTGVELRQNGSVSVGTFPTSVPFEAGTNPLVISADTTIGVVTVAPAASAAPAIFVDPALPNAFSYAIYAAGKPITSLKVDAGATLTFEDQNEIRARVQGDVLNQGTITANITGDSGYMLTLETRNFNNDANAKIDMRAEGARTIPLEIWALYGGTAAIRNVGTIVASGRDSDDTLGPGYPTAGETVRLSALGDVMVGGAVATKGGSAGEDNTGAYGQRGGDVIVQTLKGNLYNDAAIETSGGSGDGGASAGSIVFFNGDDRTSPSRPHPLTQDPAQYGPGSFAGVGTFTAVGGEARFYASGGTGGNITLRVLGGSIRSNIAMDAQGGGAIGQYTYAAGQGGTVLVRATTWTGFFGEVTPVVPEGIFFGPPSSTTVGAGSINVRGGRGQNGATGGYGGSVGVFLDVHATRGEGLGSGSSDQWTTDRGYDTSKLTTSSAKPRIAFYGYGGGILAKGGDNATDGESSYRPDAGNGGRIEVGNNVCAYNCVIPGVNERLVYNDAKLDVSGGRSENYGNGSGGSVLVELTQGNNQVQASSTGALLKVAGAIDANGYDSVYANGNYASGGNVNLIADSGKIDIAAPVNLNGGKMGSESTNAGSGGYFYTQSFLIAVNNTVSAVAGVADEDHGGGGVIEIGAYRATIAATGVLVVHGYGTKGANIDVSADEVTNAGRINCDGDAIESSEGDLFGSSGCSININARTFVNTGFVTSDGAPYLGGPSGDGGSISISTNLFTNTGTISASGADNNFSPASGGEGGSIYLDVQSGTSTTTLRADGGRAGVGGTGVESATGGSGGFIRSYSNNTLPLSASGGDAASQGTAAGKVFGGVGGEIEIDSEDGTRDNDADLTAKGGNAGGTIAGTRQGGKGGIISVDGKNAAGSCLDVSGGTGVAAGALGTLTLESGQMNYCE